MVAGGNSTVNIIDIQTLLVSLAAVFWDVTQRSLLGERCVTFQTDGSEGAFTLMHSKKAVF